MMLRALGQSWREGGHTLSDRYYKATTFESKREKGGSMFDHIHGHCKRERERKKRHAMRGQRGKETGKTRFQRTNYETNHVLIMGLGLSISTRSSSFRFLSVPVLSQDTLHAHQHSTCDCMQICTPINAEFVCQCVSAYTQVYGECMYIYTHTYIYRETPWECVCNHKCTEIYIYTRPRILTN